MLPEILRSKRFWSALVGLVMMIVVNAVPDLKDNAELLTQAVLVIVGLLIGGYSLEDVTRAMKE